MLWSHSIIFKIVGCPVGSPSPAHPVHPKLAAEPRQLSPVLPHRRVTRREAGTSRAACGTWHLQEHVHQSHHRPRSHWGWWHPNTAMQGQGLWGWEPSLLPFRQGDSSVTSNQASNVKEARLLLSEQHPWVLAGRHISTLRILIIVVWEKKAQQKGGG